MKTHLTLGILAGLAGLAGAVAAEKDTRVYEMRTYYAAPGKFEDMHARFRNHALRLFEKHGMVSIGYWVPLENPDHKMIYVLAFPGRDAREKMWKAFMADPEWQSAYKASEVNGRLVNKVDSVLLAATDYSPAIKPGKTEPPRCFELRTYTASPGNLDHLNARFRNHTVKLFQKHGMTQAGYWTPMDKDKGADNTLVYLLAHRSKEAAAASFKAFREDPDWIAAKKASEVNGALTSKVESLFMAPTDYSPMR